MRIPAVLAFCLIVCIVPIGCDHKTTSGTKTQTTTTTPGGQTTTTTEKKTETTPSSDTTTTTQTIETKGDNRPEPNP